MNIDPKARFAASQYAKDWGKTVATEVFTEAVSVAMLQMVSCLPVSDNRSGLENQAAANNYRLEGARQFLAILCNLTTKVPDNKVKRGSETLDWSA